MDRLVYMCTDTQRKECIVPGCPPLYLPFPFFIDVVCLTMLCRRAMASMPMLVDALRRSQEAELTGQAAIAGAARYVAMHIFLLQGDVGDWLGWGI